MAIVSVQRGQTTLPNDTPVNVTISAVTMANAWVNLIGVRCNTVDSGVSEWRRQQVSARLTSTTNIEIAVANSPEDSNIVEWEVIEDDELTVQRGQLTSYSNNPGTNNVTITAVTLASSWVCTWASADMGGSNEFGIPTCALTTTTNLQFVTDDAGFGVIVSWQVIEDTGSRLTVQRVNGTLGTGTTVDVTITAVDLSKTWVRGYAFRSGSGNPIDADHEVHFFLQATTTLRFERTNTAPSSWDYTAEVIESTEVDVQRGQLSFGANATVNATISAVVMAETFVMMGQSYTGNARSNDAANVDNDDINTTSLTSTTNVQGERVDNTSNGVLSRYEVVSEALTAVPLPGKRPINPVRPVLQKNKALANGLVASVCLGWVKGFRANENDDLAMDDRTKRRGDIQGSKSGTFGINRWGRQCNGGNSDDRLEWDNGPGNQLGNIDVEFGTVMMTFQPDIASGASEQGILTKRDGGGGAQAGWSIQSDDGGTGYEIEVSDGTSNNDSGNDGPDMDTRTPQIIAGRFDTEKRDYADIWVDGILGSSQSGLSVAGSPTNFENVEVFGFDGDDGRFGQVNMFAVYDRFMPDSAIQQHNRDPYYMWRSQDHKRYFQGPGGLVGAYQTYFLAF